MKKSFIIIFFFLFCNLFELSSKNYFIEIESNIRWVTIYDIKNSLKRKNYVVGFDIDDTILFSSPGFYKGQQMYSPNSPKFLEEEEFWEKMNNEWDEFSIPKIKALDVAKMHLKRGDEVIFITAREKTKTENLTNIIKRLFEKEFPDYNPKVFFTGLKKDSKVSVMLDNKVDIYYGDSDSDIIQARKANARGIRIIRARNANHKPIPESGALGEEVLVNSDY
jgi:acid phosphatase (class B)